MKNKIKVVVVFLVVLLIGCEKQRPEPQISTYDLTVSLSDSTLGTVTGSGDYMEGEQVLLEVIVNDTVLFDGWSIDGTVISTEPVYEYTMPSQDVVVTANVRVDESTIIKRINMLLPPEELIVYPDTQLSIDGMVVQVEYLSGDTEIINNDELDINYPSYNQEGPYVVEVNYQGWSTFFLVTYEPKRLEVFTLISLIEIDQTVDWYVNINYSIDEEEEYQADVLNPLIAAVQFNPDYPQNFTVTGLQEGTTEIVVRLVSDSSKSLTIPVTVVEELPPSITTDWPDEYLNLILGELSDEIIPIEGTSYTFEPSMVLGDFYHFIIDHPSMPIDFVSYAIMMKEQGWDIVRYVPNSTQFRKNNVSVSLGYNSTTDQVHLQIKKQGDPFVNIDVTRQMNQIIGGKIHEDVSLLPLPDFEFYEYVTSMYSWQHSQAEVINVFGFYLNDTEFTGEGYATELLELGFTTVTDRDQVWYIDPNEHYMVFYGFNEHFIQLIIQSTDYYADPYHFDHDVEQFR